VQCTDQADGRRAGFHVGLDVNDELGRLFGNEIHGDGGVFQDLGTGALCFLERAELCGVSALCG
jgi:hypothetical protein